MQIALAPPFLEARAPRPLRVGAGLLSAAIVLGFLGLLDGLMHRPDAATTTPGAVLLTLRLLAAPKPPPTLPLPARPPASSQGRRQVLPAEPGPVAPALPESPPDSPAPAAILAAPSAESAEAAASAALSLDAATLRAALPAGKSAVQQLADASGKSLHTRRPSKDEQLAASIADAGVPGCLRPDAMKHQPAKIGPIVLGGVLAAPFWVQAALTGKCK